MGRHFAGIGARFPPPRMQASETQEFKMTTATPERLVSCDSHVQFTNEWIKDRLSARLKTRWDEACAKMEEYQATELRRGLPQLQIEDFVDMDAAMDPGHFEPHAKLKAMDRDGVQSEVIFPEVGAIGLALKATTTRWRISLRSTRSVC
jgi:hypothetical protein